jgi:hypothetical protein
MSNKAILVMSVRLKRGWGPNGPTTNNFLTRKGPEHSLSKAQTRTYSLHGTETCVQYAMVTATLGTRETLLLLRQKQLLKYTLGTPRAVEQKDCISFLLSKASMNRTSAPASAKAAARHSASCMGPGLFYRLGFPIHSKPHGNLMKRSTDTQQA